MALVLFAMLLTSVVASVLVQLSLGYTHLELGKYLLWYVLPTTWDMLLLAALAVFVQAISPHKIVGWGSHGALPDVAASTISARPQSLQLRRHAPRCRSAT